MKRTNYCTSTMIGLTWYLEASAMKSDRCQTYPCTGFAAMPRLPRRIKLSPTNRIVQEVRRKFNPNMSSILSVILENALRIHPGIIPNRIILLVIVPGIGANIIRVIWTMKLRHNVGNSYPIVGA